MKILQRIPIWIAIVIVSIIGIVQVININQEEVRKLEYSLETMEGSAEVLEGMAVEIELYDSTDVYWYDTFKNQTSIWNSVVSLTDTKQSMTDYKYAVRTQEEYAYLRLTCGDIFTIYNELQNMVTIGAEGGTYYLKNYMDEILIDIYVERHGERINQKYSMGVDATTFPITLPVTEDMCIKVGREGKSNGYVSESREISAEGIPNPQFSIPMVVCGERLFFTASETALPSEYYEGVTGIMELQEDGKIKVLYGIPHNSKEEEKVIGLSCIGDNTLVLVTKKNQTLLAYCYNVEKESITDTITLCDDMPENITDAEITFTEQGNYLNMKIVYLKAGETGYTNRKYFYGTVLLQDEKLNCAFSVSSLKPLSGEIQILHSKWLEQTSGEELLYFRDGMLYEMYHIWYVIDEEGNISDIYSGLPEDRYTNGIMLCVFDEEKMIYYGKLHGIYETISNFYSNRTFWTVGTMNWAEKEVIQ